MLHDRYQQSGERQTLDMGWVVGQRVGVNNSGKRGRLATVSEGVEMSDVGDDVRWTETRFESGQGDHCVRPAPASLSASHSLSLRHCSSSPQLDTEGAESGTGAEIPPRRLRLLKLRLSAERADGWAKPPRAIESMWTGGDIARDIGVAGVAGERGEWGVYVSASM